jgi:hypothetical protein
MLVPVFRSRQPLAHDNCQIVISHQIKYFYNHTNLRYIFCSFLHIPTEERVQENS